MVKNMKDIQILNQYDFKFKKKYGQNFLNDDNILNNIVTKSEITKDTLVMEIGVGAGALTLKMQPYAKNIIGYEIDKSLKNILDDKFKDKNNVEIIYCDFLQRNIKDDLEKYNYSDLYVISNLPYYITTPIINKLISDKIDVSKIVVMVQKEVGDRFNAKPGTKEYNSLTIFLNYYFDINKLLDVSRNSFVPKPNVDSVVIQMKRKNKKYNVDNEELFFKIVRDAFTYKRKNLKNNLKKYNLDKIDEVLHKHNLDLNVRAESLSIDIFIEISNYLNNDM